MIIDQDTAAFLLQALPQLRLPIAMAAIVLGTLLLAAWRIDSLRIRRRIALSGTACCMGALVALAMSFPTNLAEDFSGQNYVSKFARTGVEAVYELIEQGYLEKANTAPEHISTVPVSCKPDRKLPHIILVHDDRHKRGARDQGAAKLFGFFPFAGRQIAEAHRRRRRSATFTPSWSISFSRSAVFDLGENRTFSTSGNGWQSFLSEASM